MTAPPENSSTTCPRCGKPFVEHARLGFCTRCAASVAFDDAELTPPVEEDVARVLPPIVASAGLQPRFGDYELLDGNHRAAVCRDQHRKCPTFVPAAAETKAKYVNDHCLKCLWCNGWLKPTEVIRNESMASGMRSLRESGILKIFDGLTTIDEVVRETLAFD